MRISCAVLLGASRVGTVSGTSALLLSNAATSRIYFQPNADFNGSAALTIRGWDRTSGSNGGRADTSTNGGTSAFSSASDSVVLTVNAVADIVADTVTTAEDTAVTINVLGNDSFESGARAMTEINGSAVTVGTALAVSNGTLTLRSDGKLDFNPAADFNGQTSFTYTVTSGGVSETATVTVNVTAVADAPRLTPPDPSVPDLSFDPATGNYSGTTPEDAAFNGRVTATDPDGNTLTFTVSIQPAHGTVSIIPGTGEYTYTPTKDYYGADSFVVTVSDGTGGSVQTTVKMSVTAKADIAPETVTTNEDTLVNIDVNANDINGLQDLRGTGSSGFDARPWQQVMHPIADRDRQASVPLSSLTGADGLRLDLISFGPQVWITLDAQSGVRELRATLADGKALPAWVRVETKGVLVIDRPAGVESLRLRLTVVHQRGQASVQTIEVDFNSGQMRRVGEAEATGAAGRPSRQGGAAQALALDFAAQVQQAAFGTSPAHNELLELLEELG